MTRILFVCHGNICRSPMAEFICKDLAQKQGVADRFFVQSAATSSEEICGTVGNPVYTPAKAQLEKHGISCAGKYAAQLRKDDYDRYDLFVCMDDNNIRNIFRIFGADPQKKVVNYSILPRAAAMLPTRGIRVISTKHTAIFLTAVQHF